MSADAQHEAVAGMIECAIANDRLGNPLDVEQIADEIIAAYEAAAWVDAEDVPMRWGGQRGFIWNPSRGQVEPYTIPTDHSRNPRHCGGVMFRLWPTPPKEPSDA